MATSQNYQGEFRNAIKAAIQPWVEWKHISMGFTHCPICLKLDKCWFVADNMPQLPQHPGCHCTAEKISNSQVKKKASATSPYGKFGDYLFNAANPKNKGKAQLFEGWGYSTAAIPWMIEEYERQALEKYIAGDYTLGILDEYGQRINIQITLQRKDEPGTLMFRTGWVAYPNGSIKLATPYGGKK